jgi:hypothetical protein
VTLLRYGDGLIVFFLACLDGCSSLNVKAFTKILKKFVKVLYTTSNLLGVFMLHFFSKMNKEEYMLSFELGGQ